MNESKAERQKKLSPCKANAQKNKTKSKLKKPVLGEVLHEVLRNAASFLLRNAAFKWFIIHKLFDEDSCSITFST